MSPRNLFYHAVKTGILISLLTPLVIGPFGLSFSAFPKAIFFNSVIELTFIFYVGLVFMDRKFLPKINIVLVSVLIYEFLLFFTSFIGINFYRSFFGDPVRAEGLVLHLHLIVFLIIICSVYCSRNEWLGLMKVIVCVSAISCLAAIGQKLNLWSLYGVSLPYRVSGTLSNPDFFAPYVVSAFFISLFVYFAEKEKDLKFLWLFIAGLNFIGLVLSGTRGAWVGFSTGMTVFATYYVVQFYLKSKYRIRLVTLFSVLIFLISVLIIFSNPEGFHLRGNYYFETFYSIFEMNLGSRLDVWKLSIDAWKDRPMFGWGSDSMSYVYDKYFKAEYLKHIPENMYFDHPHNKLIEILVYAGIIGLLSYLALFVAVGLYVYKRHKENGKNEGVYLVIIFSFFIAYFFQNIFYFDAISNYILFFFALGFVASMLNKETSEEDSATSLLKWPLFTLFIFCTLFVFYKINFQPFFSALWFPRYSSYENSDPVKVANGYANSLKEKTIYSQDFSTIISERLLFLIENKSIKKNDLNVLSNVLTKLKPEIEDNLKKPDRRMANNFEYLARIQEREFIKNGDVKFIEEMKSTLKKAILFNPEIAVFYQLMGEAEMLQGQYNFGEKNFLKSFELSAKTDNDKILLYKKIGVGYQKAGKVVEALNNFEKAMELTFEPRKFLSMDSRFDVNNEISEFISFAEAVAFKYYSKLNNREKCVEIYKKLIEFYPGYKKTLEERLDDLLAE